MIQKTQPTAILTLAQLILQPHCIYIYEVEIFLRKLLLTFLRHSVHAEPAETNYYFPATPGPRLTHSQQQPKGTIQRQTNKNDRVLKNNQIIHTVSSHLIN